MLSARYPVKTLIKSAVLRQNPVRGTVRFAILYFSASFLLDWVFRWTIANNPMPPLWTVVVTNGIGTAISSVVVWLLLFFMKRQREALEELNHEVRNALQILSYAIPQCDEDTRPRAQSAIESMSDSLRRISQRLGMVSERSFKPTVRE